MTPTWLRPLLIVAFVVGLIVSIGDAISGARVSAVPYDLSSTNEFGIFTVTTLKGADVVGDVRVGDRLSVEAPAKLRYVYLLLYPVHARFTDLRTGRTVLMSDPPRKTVGASLPVPIFVNAIEAGALLLLLLRGRRLGVTSLAVFLFLTQFTFAASRGAWLGQSALTIYNFAQAPLMTVSFVALLILAASFAWYRRSGRIVACIGFGIAALSGAMSVVALMPITVPPALFWLLGLASGPGPNAILVLIAVALFALAAQNASVPERRRLTILGASVLVGSTISLYSLFGGPALYDTVESTIALIATVAMTAGLVYAILVEQMFDFAFVLNRTLVYGLLTTTLAGMIGLADWFVKGRISQAHLADAVNAVVALGIAVVFTQARTWLTRIVERLFFAQRYAAERHLERVGAALAIAEERESINAALVDEVRTWLRLSSVAVFAAHGRDFERIAAHGWGEADRSHLPAEDLLVRTLALEREPIELKSLRWSIDALPEGRERPTYAVPLFFRLHMIGFVLFGPHRDGTHLDPEERTIVRRLCGEAAIAYKALEYPHVSAPPRLAIVDA